MLRRAGCAMDATSEVLGMTNVHVRRLSNFDKNQHLSIFDTKERSADNVCVSCRKHNSSLHIDKLNDEINSSSNSSWY